MAAVSGEEQHSPSADSRSHRTLFPLQEEGEEDATLMGSADRIHTPWTFTPVADRLQQRFSSRQLPERSQQQILALPVPSTTTSVTATAAAEALLQTPHQRAATVKDTYWIPSEPRPPAKPAAERESTNHPEPMASPLSLPTQTVRHGAPLPHQPRETWKEKERANWRKDNTGSESSSGPRGTSTDTVAPPPLPLQGSPAGRQLAPLHVAPAPGGALCGSFAVRKHHASRAGTGRRILTIRRETAGAGRHAMDTVISLRKLQGSRSGPPPLPWGSIASSGRTAERGTGECCLRLVPQDHLEAFTGTQAYTSGSIHRSKVRRPECCLVLRCNGFLVAAVEMENDDELQLAKAVLSSVSA